ncbi:hypothetical protein GUJ93_ZPchr0744g33362 [Zizania palustris]|uniref:Uncharacterized protein n=1 Tax=Zizania palustris TaxID=103762 RepID=A0A8J5QUP5_ZIZPA|nr:hypothetical protein GUJ93_ZPchr0744g33362 [Zizania palustris]
MQGAKPIVAIVLLRRKRPGVPLLALKMTHKEELRGSNHPYGLITTVPSEAPALKGCRQIQDKTSVGEK